LSHDKSIPAFIYPADLFEQVGAPLESRGGRTWWLLHTKSRQEKKVAELLHGSLIPFYLPLVQQRAPDRGRVRINWIPLFRGYVFLWGNDDDRLAALKTNRIAAIHPVLDGGRLTADLANFALLIAQGAALTPESKITAGKRVKVKSGPFSGVEGIVSKRQGKTKLLIVLEAILQGASLNIEDCQLEVI
jgi:hypothetical protein